jgi:hypothetical protein
VPRSGSTRAGIRLLEAAARFVLGTSMGRLVADSGRTTELSPGVTTLLPEGLCGRVVDTTLTKVFTVHYI